MSSAGANITANLTLNLEGFESKISEAIRLVDSLQQDLNSLTGSTSNTGFSKMVSDAELIDKSFKNLVKSATEVGNALTESLDVTKAEALVKTFNEIQVGANQVATSWGEVNNQILKQQNLSNSVFVNMQKEEEAQLLIAQAMQGGNAYLEERTRIMGKINDLQIKIIEQQKTKEGLDESTIYAMQEYLTSLNEIEAKETERITLKERMLSLIAQEIDLSIARAEAEANFSQFNVTWHQELAAQMERQRAELEAQVKLLPELNTGFEAISNAVKSIETYEREWVTTEENLLSIIAQEIDVMIARNAASTELVALSREYATLEKESEAALKLKTQQINQIVSRMAEELGLSGNILSTLEGQLAAEEMLAKLTGDTTALKSEEMVLIKDIVTTVEQLIAADEKDLATNQEKIALLQDQLALYKEMATAASSSSKGSSRSGNAKNKLDSTTYLGNRTASMFATMMLFNEAMDVYEKTMDKVNASSQITYFGQRLGMTQKQISSFSNEINNLQKVYKKIDMTSIGATAEEAAVKYGLQTSSLSKLAETYAIVGTAFKKEGRTQEDAILAVNDAMDGEFRRLKELGISQDDLKAAGWGGDKNDKEGIMNALKTIMDQRGFTQTAQDVTSFSDALEVAKLQLADFLMKLFQFAEPSLTKALMIIVGIFDAIGAALDWLGSLPVPNWVKDVASWAGAGAIIGVLALYIGKKLVSAMLSAIETGKEFLKTIRKVLTTVNNEIPDKTKDTSTTTTGGTKPSKNGGFMDNFKKVTGDLGTMARYFVDAMVGLAMAFVLVEEGMLILNGIGWTYSQMEEGVNKGVEAVYKVSGVIVPIVVAVTAFNIALSKFNIGLDKAGMITSALNIALIMAETALVIGMLYPSIWMIAQIGYINSDGMVDAGVKAIDSTAHIILPIMIAIAVLGAVLAYPIVGEVSSLLIGKGMLEAALLIAEAMLLTSVVIAALSVPIAAIASIGSTYGDNADVTSGITVIDSTSHIILPIANAILALGTSMGIAGGLLNGIVKENITNATEQIKQGIEASAEVITKLSEPLNSIIELGATFDVNQITQGALIISNLSTALTSLQSAVTTISQTTTLMTANPMTATPETFQTTLGFLEQDIGYIKDFMVRLMNLGLAEIGDTTAIVTFLNTAATTISSIKTSVENVKSVVGAIGDASNAAGGIGATVGNAIGGNASIKGALDMMYNSIAEIYAFLGRVNSLVAGNSATGATAIASINSMITSLTTALNSFVSAVNSQANALKTAGANLGQALANGVNSKQGTVRTAGSNLGKSMADGVRSGADPASAHMAGEIDEILSAISSRESEVEAAGRRLGQAFVRGYKSQGLDSNSPGLAARTTAEEVVYILQNINDGVSDVVKAGANLGSALANSYSNNANLKTDISALGKTSIDTKRSNVAVVQPTQQPSKGTNNVLYIDMKNTTIYGIEDLENKMQTIANNVFVDFHSSSDATGL